MPRSSNSMTVAAPATPRRDPLVNPVIEPLAFGLARLIEASSAEGDEVPESAETSLDFRLDPRLSGPTGTPAESGEAGDVEA